MKNAKWRLLATVLFSPIFSSMAQQAEAPVPQVSIATGQAPSGAPAVPSTLSPSVAEVIKLSESGTGEEVVLAYIQNSSATFNLTADDILYLRDIGISSTVISAMINHDTTLRSEPQPLPSAQTPPVTQPPPTTQAPPPEQAPPQAAAPEYVSSPPLEVNYFYNDLAPYGTWVSLEGVGWCWQPRAVVVSRSWRPYCDGGHWVYSDCGWYWQSDYSWGWAPFHYGRWQLHDRCGWVWTPDRVWGPAWVTWRRSGDYCGWAPLPPRAYFDVHSGYHYNGVSVGVGFDFGLHASHFSFVAVRDFNHHDLSHRRLPPTEVKNIYNHTTVINNYTVNNNTIVNRGIPVEHVSAATHTQIQKAVLRDAPAGSRVTTRAQGPQKDAPVVLRHELRAPAQRQNVVAQKIDARHPVVQHAAITPVAPARNEHSGRPVSTSPTPVFGSSRTQPQTRVPQQERSLPQKPSPATPTVQAPLTPRRPETVQPNPTPALPRTAAPKPTAEAAPYSGQHPVTTRPVQTDSRAQAYYPKSDNRTAPPAAVEHPFAPRQSTSKSADDSGSKPKH